MSSLESAADVQPTARITDEPRVRSVSPGRRTVKRFFSHRLAMIGAIILVFMTICAILAPLLAPPLPGKITINTIDGFQGQERDVIYISLVRSNEKHEIGFLQDYRRMNVAMTRARMLLVVIGDSATIGKNPFYQAFLDYVAEHGAYRTAWEFM